MLLLPPIPSLLTLEQQPFWHGRISLTLWLGTQACQLRKMAKTIRLTYVYVTGALTISDRRWMKWLFAFRANLDLHKSTLFRHIGIATLGTCRKTLGVGFVLQLHQLSCAKFTPICRFALDISLVCEACYFGACRILVGSNDGGRRNVAIRRDSRTRLPADGKKLSSLHLADAYSLQRP